MKRPTRTPPSFRADEGPELAEVSEAREREGGDAPESRSAPPSLPPAVEQALRDLVASVNDQVRALDDGSGAVRRRLIALLLDDAKRQASERLALRARLFVEQKGRCAACDQPFDARRRPIPPRPHAPLFCSACDRVARRNDMIRDEVTSRERTSVPPPASMSAPPPAPSGEPAEGPPADAVAS